MVKKDSLYLLIGLDNLAKDAKLKKIRQELLPKEVEQFNLDILYGRELELKDLQERLLCLPVKAKKRIVVIKGADALKEEIKEFLQGYLKKPYSWVVLVLDLNQQPTKDEFINNIIRYAETYRFKETFPINTFTLTRQIELRRPDYALRILNQLLKEGEKPERILGGLRYACENQGGGPLQIKRTVKLLLNCDVEIKTGRLKPVFALEKLVINLCCRG